MTHPPCELSFSRLNELECPWHYQQTNIRGVDEPDNYYAAVGTCAHAFAALYGEALVRMNILREARYAKMPHRRADDDQSGGIGWLPRHDGIGGQLLDDLLLKMRPDLVDDVREVCEIHLHKFKLERDTEYVYEHRLAVGRDFKPCEPDAPIDRFGGTPDLVEIKPDLVRITDEKMGFMRFGLGALAYQHDGTLTKLGRQLMTYAAMYMMHHDDVHEVSVRARAPRYYSQDDHAWTREQAVPVVQQWIREAWATVDAHREQYGESDWPAIVCKNCEYCALACPRVEVEAMYEECAI